MGAAVNLISLESGRPQLRNTHTPSISDLMQLQSVERRISPHKVLPNGHFCVTMTSEVNERRHAGTFQVSGRLDVAPTSGETARLTGSAADRWESCRLFPPDGSEMSFLALLSSLVPFQLRFHPHAQLPALTPPPPAAPPHPLLPPPHPPTPPPPSYSEATHVLMIN